MSNTTPASAATLSLCLIVRNGGPALAEALSSARPFMDEMVVVDTGSTDDSRQVAAGLGARVVEFPWCDDFSAARNFSLEQATGDWIFWMDADDVLPAASGRELRRLIGDCPGKDAAFWVNVEEDVPAKPGVQPRTMAHAHIKLFPRHPGIRFCYRIHEQVAPAIRALGLPIRRTQAVVRHAHAGRSPEAERARAERNLRLVNLDLQDRPDDPFVWLSVGTAHLFAPRGLPKAIEFLRRSVAGLKRGSATQLNAYLYLGQALGTSGDRLGEGQVYREALELFPDDAVLLMRLGTVCQHAGRLDEAAAWYRAVLERGRLRPSVIHVSGGHVHAALRLGQLYVRQGRPGQAESLWRHFLEQHPEAATVQRALDGLAPASMPSRHEALAAAHSQQNFLFIITAYNVRPFLNALVASLARQRWALWQAVFVDDGSTDGTLDALRSLLTAHRLAEKFTLVAHHERQYKAYGVYHAIKNHGSPEDVVAIVDGDDHLAGEEALDRLAREYDQGWEVVWSNWRGSDGCRGTSSHLNPFVSPRRQPLVSSHLFTFKRRLFEAVTERDLQDDDGRWFEAGCDVAVAWPLLDQTIKRKHIEDVLYVYNRSNPLSHDKREPGARPYVSSAQAKTSALLCRRPGKELVVDNAFLHGHLYELLRAAACSLQATTRHEIAQAIQALRRE